MWPTPADVQCKRNGSLVPPGKTPFPIPRTVPAEARSWNLKLRSPAGDFTAYMPWASPGASPVADPCGVASGFGASAHTPSYVHAPKGYRVGELGSRVLEPLPTKTVVRAGGTLETGFGVKVNHGGGYSFRLCPAGSPLTEARQPTAAAALLCSSVPPLPSIAKPHNHRCPPSLPSPPLPSPLQACFQRRSIWCLRDVLEPSPHEPFQLLPPVVTRSRSPPPTTPSPSSTAREPTCRCPHSQSRGARSQRPPAHAALPLTPPSHDRAL
jgi:hypothetical protein